MATRLLLEELLGEHGQRTGQAVALESVGGVDAARRVAAGEPGRRVHPRLVPDRNGPLPQGRTEDLRPMLALEPPKDPREGAVPEDRDVHDAAPAHGVSPSTS